MPDQPQEAAPTFFIGAYAAAPSLNGWDPSAEAKFLHSVLNLKGVAGLEVPYTNALHKYDEKWFLQQLPQHANFILTTIPGTMAHLETQPDFGLASTSPAGRQQAIDFVRTALQAVDRVNNTLGRAAVQALQIHAAPVAHHGRATSTALTESLQDIADWDWHEASIVLEHCDALIPGRTPAKGFLTLPQEAEAVERANAATGKNITMAINWGRSVIEQRRPEAALEHLHFLNEADLLGGLTISGCSAVMTRYGDAWADVHVPPTPPSNVSDIDGGDSRDDVFDEKSLLTFERLQRCLEAAGPQSETFRAIKVAAPPNAGVDQRVSAIAGTLALAQAATRTLQYEELQT